MNAAKKTGYNPQPELLKLLRMGCSCECEDCLSLRVEAADAIEHLQTEFNAFGEKLENHKFHIEAALDEMETELDELKKAQW